MDNLDTIYTTVIAITGFLMAWELKRKNKKK
jgi:hypothetical protein